MSPVAPRALARRLKGLREEQWPDVGLTQAQLAQALGGLSISLISSWENADNPIRPPIKRLEAYATLFATRRSLEGGFGLLPLDNLTDEERDRRKGLLDELLWLREGNEPAPAKSEAADLWTFEDPEQWITIVCAPLPQEYRRHLSYADPESPDFVSLYTYADPDALIELFGHLRARNPESKVTFHTSEELTADDYTSHLVLLGGVDFNTATREVIERANLPVKQVARDAVGAHGGFRVTENGESKLIEPELDEEGHLLEDVAHFYRGVSPFNRKRTVTVCNGMYSRGTLGAVRALTDGRFLDRNTAYVRERFGYGKPFSIISRVPVVGGQGLTPDWTLEENRLHEWPEAAG
ncbi:Transcriptional regulator, contains XRE-family HTH domain [Amycolatopsis pretoriensis]|uniref:Transcriptional regulator, contains XRE-family HTH domain n=1 Tax=Amycolatopsis pretoriensis TaxID=218821 RepID=A0A1H5R4W2_9PSEU|nr:helix-turn-helix transcriptional regulator [Amycolatopsis pretoriensis]SEF33084.1 Transcriptional regulator, contains XRE-family HTH domain [Amycolatopsis pretoriensis]